MPRSEHLGRRGTPPIVAAVAFATTVFVGWIVLDLVFHGDLRNTDDGILAAGVIGLTHFGYLTCERQKGSGGALDFTHPQRRIAGATLAAGGVGTVLVVAATALGSPLFLEFVGLALMVASPALLLVVLVVSTLRNRRRR